MPNVVVDALRAIRNGEMDEARRIAAGSENSLLGHALSNYLANHVDHDGSVYTDPAAFQAFIAGGGNVGLYEATAGALAAAYDRLDARSVLDLGCGDGSALVPAAIRATRAPSSFDLVDVSAALLDAATARLQALDVEMSTHENTAQYFARKLDIGNHWDLAESTFALHTLPPDERDEVLRALRPHVGELVVVEFDVPALDPGSPEHLRFLADSYERGIAEYSVDRELVAEGFLMPVLVGQLLPGAARMTYEQSAGEWAEQVKRCGYPHVATTSLYPYWSSPAFLLTANGGFDR